MIIAVLAIALVGASCGNAKTAGPSDATKVTAPTDGGEANRNTHVAISGVPGVNDKTISYTVAGTKQNNPLGSCILDCYLAGINAYFDYRNSQGGIYGRKLAVGAVVDDQLANNQTEALAIASDKNVFGSFQAGLLQGGWGELDKAGVPTYTWGIDGSSAANRSAIFPSTVISCIECTRHMIPYSAMVTGSKRVGALGYGISQNSKLCAESIGKSLKLYEKDTGAKLAYLKNDLPYGLPNGIGPEVTAMKKAGVDFIAGCFDLNGMKTLAQELKRQGMSSVVLNHPNSYNQDFISAAGGLFEGDIVGVVFRPFEATQNPALRAFKTWMAKAGSPLTELAMVGWINATLAYEGLLAAGPRFDRAKVLAGTNAMTKFTANGLISAIDWTTAHKPYTEATRSKVADPECGVIVKVENSRFQSIAPKDKPWLCWTTADTSWSTPVPTNFN